MFVCGEKLKKYQENSQKLLTNSKQYDIVSFISVKGLFGRDLMITTKEQLKEFILADSKASRRTTVRASLLGDEIWKFHLSLRKLDYYSSKKSSNPLCVIPYCFYKFRFHNLSVKLGFSIPYHNIDKGFSIAHYGCVVINDQAKIGKNCRCQEGVNIGATSGSGDAPKIGDNVFLGTGCKLIGDIEIADDVCIGAGAVVVKSITEPGTTWAGVPAKKISNNNSHSNLSPMLFEENCMSKTAEIAVLRTLSAKNLRPIKKF